jgi:hypothetical protein
MKYLFTIFISLTLVRLSVAQNKKLTLSGFGEVRVNSSFGGFPNSEMHNLFEQYGGARPIYNEASTMFSFAPFNLNLIGELNEKLTFTGELNNEIQNGELHIALYRANLKYSFTEKFNFTTGLFMTPIGYLNRNQRIYSYLNYSVLPRDMVNEDSRFIPVFTAGFMVNGTFSNQTHSFKYYFSLGENRSYAPQKKALIAFLHLTEDEYRGLNSKVGFAGGIHYTLFKEETESIIGVTGWINPIVVSIKNDVLGQQVPIDATSNPVITQAREAGFAPFVRIDNTKWQFFSEFHQTLFRDLLKNTNREKYYYAALTAEFLLKRELANKSFYPYVRYDFRQLTNNHMYYGQFEKDGVVIRTYIPDFSEVMIGSCWEPFTNNRLKLELAKAFNGAAPNYRVTISTSFSF